MPLRIILLVIHIFKATKRSRSRIMDQEVDIHLCLSRINPLKLIILATTSSLLNNNSHLPNITHLNNSTNLYLNITHLLKTFNLTLNLSLQLEADQLRKMQHTIRHYKKQKRDHKMLSVNQSLTMLTMLSNSLRKPWQSSNPMSDFDYII